MSDVPRLTRRSLLGASLGLGLTRGVAVGPTGPARPRRPGPYGLRTPHRAVLVESSRQLASALRRRHPKDIVLADGIYDHDGPVAARAGHRLWARNPPARGVPSALLRFGLDFGEHPRFAVRGLAIMLATREQAAVDGTYAAAILNHVTTGSVGGVITDCVVDGGFAITQGLQLGCPRGAVVRRCAIRRCTDEGLRISDNRFDSSARITAISDLEISQIARDPRGASDGRAEAGLWVGHVVVKGVQRIRVRDTGWMGLWTGNASRGTVFSDLDIDAASGLVPDTGKHASFGIYLERYNGVRGSDQGGNTYERFALGPSLEVGITNEWDEQRPGDHASNGAIFRDGRIRSSRIGINLGEGTLAPTIENVWFEGQTDAAIVDSTNNPPAHDAASSSARISGIRTSLVGGVAVRYGGRI